MAQDATPDAHVVAAELLALAGLAGGPAGPLTIERAEPLLPTVFRVDIAAVAAVAALSTAVATVAEQRFGHRPAIAVDGRAAQVSFRSERYLRIDGTAPADPWAVLSGDYRCADGYVKVHANFAHHAAAALRAMGVAGLGASGADRDQTAERVGLASAIARRPAVEVETAVIDAGGAAAAWRSPQEWRQHPQGRADAAAPVLRTRRLGSGAGAAARRGWPAAPGGPANGPLAGLRVLDLTRVIAGPVAGRVLSAHGADVLAVTAAHLPQVEALVIDTGFGKRSTFLDLRAAADRRVFEELVAGADAVVQSFRPGALAALGYGPEQLAACSPGIVVADVRAYGSDGPWAGRRGFDSLLQLASGIAWDGARAAGADHPVSLPCQALDHATGWLSALGVVGALCRQRADGGSWHVEVSLSGAARWLLDLGRVDALELADPSADDVAEQLLETPSGYGRLRHSAMPATFDRQPVRWRRPPPLLGSSPPAW